MGISIYYEAQRDRPLTAQEQTAIDDIVCRNEAVGGPYWESFCVYAHDEDTEPGVIFEGATKLPLTTEDEFWEEIQHRCRILTLIRRVLSDATWSVHIDDATIFWDEERREYDPSIEPGSA